MSIISMNLSILLNIDPLTIFYDSKQDNSLFPYSTKCHTGLLQKINLSKKKKTIAI